MHCSSSLRRYVSTLLGVAGADGLSPSEDRWVRDRAIVLGLPAQTLDALATGVDAATEEVKARPDSLAGKALLFDALLLAAQDGLSLAETERHGRLAERLGVTDDNLAEIRAIVAEEVRLGEKKRALFGAREADATSA